MIIIPVKICSIIRNIYIDLKVNYFILTKVKNLKR